MTVFPQTAQKTILQTKIKPGRLKKRTLKEIPVGSRLKKRTLKEMKNCWGNRIKMGIIVPAAGASNP